MVAKTFQVACNLHKIWFSVYGIWHHTFHRFGQQHCLHLLGSPRRQNFFTYNLGEPRRSRQNVLSETLVSVHQSTWLHIPEYGNHQHRCQNLKSRTGRSFSEWSYLCQHSFFTLVPRFFCNLFMTAAISPLRNRQKLHLFRKVRHNSQSARVPVEGIGKLSQHRVVLVV